MSLALLMPVFSIHVDDNACDWCSTLRRATRHRGGDDEAGAGASGSEGTSALPPLPPRESSDAGPEPDLWDTPSGRRLLNRRVAAMMSCTPCLYQNLVKHSELGTPCLSDWLRCIARPCDASRACVRRSGCTSERHACH